MLDTAALLTLSPARALVAAYNDFTGLQIPPGQALFSAPQDAGDGMTQVSLSIRPPLSAVEVLPYTGVDTFQYQRMNLADLWAVIESSMSEYTLPLPTTTKKIVEDLQTLFGIVSDDNDFVIEEILDGATQYTLKAAANSLRWVGEMTLTFSDSLVTTQGALTTLEGIPITVPTAT